ncbi:MAG TPA: DMT family transporter [Steroidobacteraceae bacterium]|nr:DMT family transporter [Steroidobacteraceae bacterium]
MSADAETRALAGAERFEPPASSARRTLALIVLITGGLGIASAGIFVRLSETGPTATAFWRGALALPCLAVWAAWESWRNRARGARRSPRRLDVRFFWSGLFFAGDLALWHWSLLMTSVAASTLEANLAPVLVSAIAWVVWRERPRPQFLLALALALAGVVLIVVPKLGGSGRALTGDLLGIATAGFYAGYILVVSRLRAVHGTGAVMLWTTLIFTALLLPLALTQKFLPDTAHGWVLLVGLALTAQFFGQGMIAYALAHLPPTYGSIGLYVQPVGAAVYARLILGERLAPVQIAGAAIVLAAIVLARRSQSA